MSKVLPSVDPIHSQLKKFALTLKHLATQKGPVEGKIPEVYARGINDLLGEFARSMTNLSQQQHSIFTKRLADAKGAPALDDPNRTEFDSPRNPSR